MERPLNHRQAEQANELLGTPKALDFDAVGHSTSAFDWLEESLVLDQWKSRESQGGRVVSLRVLHAATVVESKPTVTPIGVRRRFSLSGDDPASPNAATWTIYELADVADELFTSPTFRPREWADRMIRLGLAAAAVALGLIGWMG